MKNDDRLIWKPVRTEHIVQDEWIDFRRQYYEFPDGKEYGPFYTASRRNYVVIAAIDEEGKWLTVHQYRQGIARVDVEFPAGGIEDKEDAQSAAVRELLEETGYSSRQWSHLLKISSSPTDTDNTADLFLARGCTRVSAQHLDAQEFLEFECVDDAKLAEMLQEGSFAQPVHALCWYLAKEMMKKQH